VAARDSGPDALGALLEELRVPAGAPGTPAAVTETQITQLLGRIAAVTAWLRRAGDAGDASRAAVRLMLADVAMVAAQFRGNTTALDARLEAAIESARQALERSTDDVPSME
jgi:hypothetical protein